VTQLAHKAAASPPESCSTTTPTAFAAVRPMHDKIGSATLHLPSDTFSSRQAKGEGR
jgi:hypothetical protein